MKKYFFMSDIHSYAKCMKEALKRAGFNKNNPNHILVICGDVFDRGFDTLEVFDYLMSLPKERRVMIRGNHELLYLELLESNFPGQHDFSNGTVRTFCAIACIDETELNIRAKIADSYIFNNGSSKSDVQQEVMKTWQTVKQRVEASPITAWLRSDEWVNYFEIDDLICVHSFIPLRVRNTEETKWIKNYPPYQVHPRLLEVIPNWRTEAKRLDWEDATWGCPYKQFDAGLFNGEIEANPKKKLVCGHWHVSDFHNNYHYDPTDTMNLKIYFGDNLVGLDACTAVSQFCNVLVYDQKSKKYFDQFKNDLEAEVKIPTVKIETVPAKHYIVDSEEGDNIE